MRESACGVCDLEMWCVGARQEKPSCEVARGGAWKECRACELRNKTFESRMGAYAVSDGVEASTNV